MSSIKIANESKHCGYSPWLPIVLVYIQCNDNLRNYINVSKIATDLMSFTVLSSQDNVQQSFTAAKVILSIIIGILKIVNKDTVLSSVHLDKMPSEFCLPLQNK